MQVMQVITALPGFKHWHESKDALPQAITHEGFLSNGEHW